MILSTLSQSWNLILVELIYLFCIYAVKGFDLAIQVRQTNKRNWITRSKLHKKQTYLAIELTITRLGKKFRQITKRGMHFLALILFQKLSFREIKCVMLAPVFQIFLGPTAIGLVWMGEKLLCNNSQDELYPANNSLGRDRSSFWETVPCQNFGSSHK